VRLDWTRLARGMALAAYAGFFSWLWLSDRMTAYVGPRTTWVVAFGAISLTLVALCYLATVPTREQAPAPGPGELARLGLLVAPLLFAIMVPAQTLGAFAVEQKRGTAASVDRLGSAKGKIRIYEIAAAAQQPEWGKERGIVPGRTVEFDGLVSRPEKGGSLELSRFLVTCCVADAMPYSVRVLAPQGFPPHEKGAWLRVRGRLEPASESGGLIVVASSVRPTKRPADPYS
jgi:uncharacterized repeat protein (TIGR03943 family)